MATPSSFGNGNSDNMNAFFWGKLQIFIDLSMIYAKLPLAPFFRLRQVCKEWNCLASDRQFLEHNFKPLISPNPYFILNCPNEGHVLLISEGSLWTSSPVPRMQCEMSGLLFEDSDRNRVFDLHTRIFHTLPPLLASMQLPQLPAYHGYILTMMTVDTTQIPYGFRIIIADDIIGTRIYESNCGFWTHKPSTPEYCLPAYRTSYVHYNKSLYTMVKDVSMWRSKIQTYNLERDEWNIQDISKPITRSHYSNMGMFFPHKNRWFLFLEEDWLDLTSDLTVWKSASNFKEPWTLFDYMPKDLHEWMKGSGHSIFMNKFCGEHVLLWNRFGSVKRAILYSLDRKTWDKIELPTIPELQ